MKYISMGLCRRKDSKVALASLTGTAIEWFDFFLYNVATALIFTQLGVLPGFDF